jgi:LacI family transcriptional regulator
MSFLPCYRAGETGAQDREGGDVRRKVTIDEIARQSSASRTTVSLVLRDKPGIGTETRKRVWAAARALGYQKPAPPPIAPGQGVLNIGLIQRSRRRAAEVRLPGVNAFYSWVLAGIEAAARPQRMNLLYATLEVDDDNQPLDLPEHLLSQHLDGILLIGSFAEETIAEVARHGANAIVLVDAPAGSATYDAIVSDNEAGAYTVVSHLIERGHRRIAYVSPGPLADPNFNQRRDGYLRALQEHGLDAYPAPMTADNATAATIELLRRQSDVTALFACNDGFAIRAIRAAQDIGQRVPADLSVAAFDDIELSAQITPGLTTMAVDKVSMGRLAVQTLSYRLTWPEAAKMLITLRPELIVRDSVAPIPTAAEDSEG